MSPPPCVLCFLSFLLCIFPIISPALHLPLTQFHTNSSRDTYLTLKYLVSSSLARAHHLKHPQTTTKAGASPATTPLFSHSYGGYSISLSFGTPPQALPFVMDTGSDIVWFPCTHRYVCKNCSSSPSKNNIPTFIPKQSSSSQLVSCQNPKCSWIHHTNATQCDGCGKNSTPKNCTQNCPPYFILYGSGTTAGVALSETLNLGDRTVPDFLVGCSIFSSRQPAGVAGFGRGLPSLPTQLKLRKFSYCLISRRFDDSTSSSTLILDGNSDFDEKTKGLTYTPFLKNPIVEGKESFQVYYYIGLRKITVGGRHVKVPYKYLSPGNDGDGGTIVDSGSTFTFMAPEIFEPVAEEFIKQVKNYSRSRDVEVLTGLRPCFDVKGGEKPVEFPELRLHLKGGAEMALPLENSFAVVGDGVACLTVVTDGGVGGGEGEVGHSGPAVVLGSFQMQNYYVEYDLRNDRLGLKQQLCI
ncbi:probable aspartyl protease At4g16563 [Durio zibethinus]|uniref:Probable aspartyl protease At4g16563 n=1 Tax=Durio zibethinus TaxID=66656 RepID=A0A6P5XTM0_DURZI|nr:probable aspartyl protease At4g16563 [Durio zibethinus]